jgi:hypothetical protein
VDFGVVLQTNPPSAKVVEYARPAGGFILQLGDPDIAAWTIASVLPHRPGRAMTRIHLAARAPGMSPDLCGGGN